MTADPTFLKQKAKDRQTTNGKKDTTSPASPATTTTQNPGPMKKNLRYLKGPNSSPFPVIVTTNTTDATATATASAASSELCYYHYDYYHHLLGIRI